MFAIDHHDKWKVECGFLMRMDNGIFLILGVMTEEQYNKKWVTPNTVR